MYLIISKERCIIKRNDEEEAKKMEFRLETDSIGQKEVPVDAYYGVQSLRGAENFPISGKTVHPEIVRAIVEVKKAAAVTNGQVGALDEEVAVAIASACDEILDGNFLDAFIVDAISGGAGTSVNMNANEVIANRAEELLGGRKGKYEKVHPNDHVNCGQSTNDAYPTAGRIAIYRLLYRVVVALSGLRCALENKAIKFTGVVKMGRTEMQDAVPISFSQCFRAYASAIKRDEERFARAKESMSMVNMGGTAIGTGITANAEYMKEVVPVLAKITGLPFTRAEDLVDSTQNLDAFVYVSGIVKSCAVTLSKMASDLRLMSSGPRTGFAEINLPARQNGSSIMPGKVNPVIPEVVNQIAFRVIGNDLTVTMAAEAGQLELNAFEPVLFYSLLESLEMLATGIHLLTKDCIEGITVNKQRCRQEVEDSIGIVTALCPKLGYVKAAKLAKRALAENKKVKDVLLEEGIIEEKEIENILDPKKMI